MLKSAGARTDGRMTPYYRTGTLSEATGFWNPSLISGMQLWLSAKSLALNNNDPIATWPDISGSGNDATQSTSGQRPLFKTGIINSLYPVVRFDGSDDSLLLASNITSAPVTIFMIANRTAGTNYRAGVTIQKVGLYLSNITNQNWSIYSGGDIHTGVATSSTHKLMTAIVTSASSLRYSTNNAAFASSAGGGAYGSTVASYIGAANPGNVQNLTGDIAEVLIYNTNISEVNAARINLWLMAQYGLT